MTSAKTIAEVYNVELGKERAIKVLDGIATLKDQESIDLRNQAETYRNAANILRLKRSE